MKDLSILISAAILLSVSADRCSVCVATVGALRVLAEADENIYADEKKEKICGDVVRLRVGSGSTCRYIFNTLKRRNFYIYDIQFTSKEDALEFCKSELHECDDSYYIRYDS